ncbi:hypothetical protein P154DRAFT_557366 [Amniculicola lignicola CBS 123094]|uniref:Fatty acid desaturase domain-containing protein n=1 Tax=Amniculicola lignicola CBS 123094 TaxID=1392246 RepID=A0A6A5W288_9PLEO|nr:hypothetical protein P154DRAFT_557366 [Amniculicola lignicola CBS 123094]
MTPSTLVAPVATAIATSSQTPLPLSSVEPDSNVNKERPRKLSQKDDTLPMVDTIRDVFQLPDYTIGDIRKAIPPEYFKRSALRGLGYIAREITLLSTTFWLFHHSVTPENVPSAVAHEILWSVYGFLDGLFGTRLWVMGHEYGHQSLFPSKVVNDTVATGHMERDIVFIPRTRSEFAKHVSIAIKNLSEVIEDAPLYSFFKIFARQLLGWPFYLLANRTALYSIRSTFGWSNLAIWYFLPYLRHTNSTLPHYDSQAWTYASEAIIPVIGCHYRSNTKGRLVGFVEPTEGVGEDIQHILYYLNKNRIGVKPTNLRT